MADPPRNPHPVGTPEWAAWELEHQGQGGTPPAATPPAANTARQPGNTPGPPTYTGGTGGTRYPTTEERRETTRQTQLREGWPVYATEEDLRGRGFQKLNDGKMVNPDGQAFNLNTQGNWQRAYNASREERLQAAALSRNAPATPATT